MANTWDAQRLQAVTVEQSLMRIGALLSTSGRRLVAAESLTGGLIAQQCAATPGSGEWFAGAVVAYHADVKFSVLGVPRGPVVTEAAASTMAKGVQSLLSGEVAAAVTGVGGPDSQEGRPPGTVCIAVAVGPELVTKTHCFDGSPEEICEQAARAVIRLVASVLEEPSGSPPRERGMQASV